MVEICCIKNGRNYGLQGTENQRGSAMSAANDMKLVMMFVRLVFTIFNGLMKLVLQGLMLIPKLINVLLTFILKLGSVLKLILESTLKMVGNFILETSRGLKGLWGK